MDRVLALLLGHLDLWTWLIALVGASLQLRRQFTWPRWAEAVLLWSAFWVLGVNGCLGFVEHLLFGPFIAERIGWPNSPFQFEVAYANLTIGILGLSSVGLRRRDYLLATMVAYGSWFFADGVGHVVSLLRDNNWAPSNVGTVLFTDLLGPILAAVLLWLSRRERTRLKG